MIVYDYSLIYTVFEIHPKSRIQYCERSELRLHFKYQKFIESAKNGQFGNFLKNWSYLKTVLPDRPISKVQKLVKRAKIEKLTMRHFWRFSTIWLRWNCQCYSLPSCFMPRSSRGSSGDCQPQIQLSFLLIGAKKSCQKRSAAKHVHSVGKFEFLLGSVKLTGSGTLH